jgi:GT2 family glycosyltransferase
MITIIYSTHKDKDYNDKFKAHLLTSVGLDNVQILEYQNNNQYSLAQVYNSGITESIYDIVVCCHNDIKLEKNWGVKILEDFSNYTEFGIIGKAGSCYFPKSGIYWENMHQTMVGQVWHHPIGHKKWINNYCSKLPFVIPVVTIDGLFISFDKTKIKHRFDESFGKFHFYDHGFCVPNYLDGVKIGVTSSFEITHESVGQPNQEFFESKDKFLEKYGDKLPLDLKPNNIYVPTIKLKETKNKVAVVIPTKSKLDLLFQCIESFYEHCNPKQYDIFIADTGSDEEELKLIEELVNKVDNIKLIKYQYYNFAKINNHIVKNYIGREYTYVLFCNNDIKLMSDVIGGMLNVFKENSKVGTVGCRLHYEDNTIQHNGAMIGISDKYQVILKHLDEKIYYPSIIGLNKVAINTAGLMMMTRFLFDKIGGFNEQYSTCFEDVELNIKCILLGFDNFCDSNLVAYHYESQTRKTNDNDKDGQFYDYKNVLLPFINKHIQTIINRTKVYKI